jgi:excisionase family DNA binding protein
LATCTGQPRAVKIQAWRGSKAMTSVSNSHLSGSPAKRFFAVHEVAALLGVSTPTIYREIRAGRLPAIRLRGRYVIPARAIDEMEQTALTEHAADGTPR